MAPVVPNPKRIRTFRTEAEFEAWLRANHAREPEVWIKIYKKDSGVPSVTAAQALDVALCWGWIDGLRKAFDRQNLFALAFRTNNMKTPAGRARKVAQLVAMLARGETIVPQRGHDAQDASWHEGTYGRGPAGSIRAKRTAENRSMRMRKRKRKNTNQNPTDAAVKELRAFGLTYPGAHTKSPWPGHLDLAVADKTFTYLSPEGEPFSISCKLPQSSAAALELPFAKPTAYGLGKSGWVTAEFAPGKVPPVELLKLWIDESYRAQAPKRLIAKLEIIAKLER